MAWRALSFFLISSLTAASAYSTEDIYICDLQLNNYKRFMINLLLSLDDVCDHLRYLESGNNVDTHSPDYHRHTFKNKIHDDIFSQIFRFAYNDLDLYIMLQNAVMERCQSDALASSMLKDRVAQKKSGTDKNADSSNEKRNSVIIGKKQRFNPWGGKRSSTPSKVSLSDVVSSGHFPTLSDTSFVY